MLRKRLPYALAAYAVIAGMAWWNLEGVWRYSVWAILFGLAMKSYLAVKKEEQS
jgi:hypothetical protein